MHPNSNNNEPDDPGQNSNPGPKRDEVPGYTDLDRPPPSITSSAVNTLNWANEMRRALVPLHAKGEVTESRLIENSVGILRRAGLCQPGWDCYIKVLSSVVYPSVGFLKSLTLGFANAAQAHNSTIERRARPRVFNQNPENWAAIGQILSRAKNGAIGISNQNLSDLVVALIKVDLSNTGTNTRSAFARASVWALKHGCTPFSLARDFEAFIHHSAYMSAEEIDSAATRININAQRAVAPSHGPAFQTFSAFDAATVRLNHLFESALPIGEIRKHIAECQEQALQSRIADKDAATTDRLLKIIDRVTEYNINRGRDPLPSIKSCISLLSLESTDYDSLEVLESALLPYHMERGLSVDSLLSIFYPLKGNPEVEIARDLAIKRAQELGRPTEPFVGISFAQLHEDTTASGPTVKVYSDAVIASNYLEPMILEPQALDWCLGEVAELIPVGLKRWSNPSVIQTMVSDYIIITAHFVADTNLFPTLEDRLHHLHSTAGWLVEQDTAPTQLHQIASFLEKYPLTPCGALCKMLEAAKFNSAMFNVVRGGTTEETQPATELLFREYRFDSVPFPMPARSQTADISKHDPRALEMHQQICEVHERVGNIAHGFGALAKEAARAPGAKHSRLVKFAMASALEVNYLNSSSNDEFPGFGCDIVGLIPERLFAQDPNNPLDPFHLYRTAWSAAKNELGDLKNTRFTFTRAFVAITPPNINKYMLYGEHYSLVILNDHFQNPWGHLGFLVPTRVLDSKLAPIRIPCERYRGYDQDHIDASESYLTIEDLKLSCNEIDSPMLDLGWPSNLGGLCNAFPPASSPLFDWENERRQSSILQDHAGHFHKTTVTGRYVNQLDWPNVMPQLQPLIQGHTDVYKLSSATLNLFDLFRYGLAQYHKGQSLTQANLDNFNFEGESEGFLEPSEWDLSQAQPPQASLAFRYQDPNVPIDPLAEPEPVNPGVFRMLEDAYRWHSGAQSSKIKQADCPVLMLQQTLDYWDQNSPIVLDTFDLTLHLPDGSSVQLPRNSTGRGKMERRLWQELVLPIAQSSRRDLRILPRPYTNKVI